MLASPEVKEVDIFSKFCNAKFKPYIVFSFKVMRTGMFCLFLSFFSTTFDFSSCGPQLLFIDTFNNYKWINHFPMSANNDNVFRRSDNKISCSRSRWE